MSIENYEFGALEMGDSFTSDQRFYRKASESTATLLREASGIESDQRVEHPFMHSTVVPAISSPPSEPGSFGFLIGQLRLTESCQAVESDRANQQSAGAANWYQHESISAVDARQTRPARLMALYGQAIQVHSIKN